MGAKETLRTARAIPKGCSRQRSFTFTKWRRVHRGGRKGRTTTTRKRSASDTCVTPSLRAQKLLCHFFQNKKKTPVEKRAHTKAETVLFIFESALLRLRRKKNASVMKERIGRTPSKEQEHSGKVKAHETTADA
jgi:hypothetical protein